MSAFQIVILIWLAFLTLGVLVLCKAIRILASQELKRDAARDKLRDAMNVQDPKSNPFLRAGMDVVKKNKKKGSQNG